jgi:hypothetical protein
MKLAFPALLTALAVGACASPFAPPAPPPAPITFSGTLVEAAGRCHIVLAENGTRYALYAGAISAGAPPPPPPPGAPPPPPGAMPPGPPPMLGTRVRVVGVPHTVQDCPGATVIRADSVTVVDAPPPPGPRVRRVRRVDPK